MTNEIDLERLFAKLDAITNEHSENEQELLNDLLLPHYDEYQTDLDSEGIAGAKYVNLNNGKRIRYNWDQRFWEIDYRDHEQIDVYINDILSFIQNLEEEDAEQFVNLYVKAINRGREDSHEEPLSLSRVKYEIAETDRRFA